MTTVLVTGSGGQVGAALADLAGDPRFDHLEIVTTDRTTLDLADPASIASTIQRVRPTIVINAAAYTAVDAAEDDEANAMAANADGVRVLAEHCAAQQARLLHLSTDYVFDGTKADWYVEDDPIAPLGAYGRSKAAGEAAARVCADHLILRTAWVYAATGHNFVKTMLRLGAERDELRVVADQVGCPTSAHDIADGLLRLADDPITGTFHLAGADATSWHGFASAIFDEAGFTVAVEPIATVDYPTPAPRPANSRLASDALAAATGVRLPGYTDSLPGVVRAILDSES
ncbi:MAG: dTDP-4-dehydrorhamnose reductase [Actinomycetota bacterium]